MHAGQDKLGFVCCRHGRFDRVCRCFSCGCGVTLDQAFPLRPQPHVPCVVRTHVTSEHASTLSHAMQVGAGQSVGNKAIVLFPSSTPVAVTAVRVRVLGAAPGGMALVQLRDVAVYKCNRPSDSGCTTTPDTKVWNQYVYVCAVVTVLSVPARTPSTSVGFLLRREYNFLWDHARVETCAKVSQ